ncbi:14320_t:CDS:1, partial [Acaulospora colombiana]
MWEAKGEKISCPPKRTVLDPRLYKGEEKYCEALLNSWLKIWGVMASAKAEVTWGIYGRFHDPRTEPKIELIFTPPDLQPRFTVDELRKIFEDPEEGLEGGFKHIQVEFKSYNEAIRLKNESKLVLLSHHFFSFYWTWVSPQNFQRLRLDRGVQDLNRPWPTKEKAGEIYAKLKEDSSGPQDGPENTFDISIGYQKMAAVAGAKRNPDQKAVMGDISATE